MKEFKKMLQNKKFLNEVIDLVLECSKLQSLRHRHDAIVIKNHGFTDEADRLEDLADAKEELIGRRLKDLDTKTRWMPFDIDNSVTAEDLIRNFMWEFNHEVGSTMAVA